MTRLARLALFLVAAACLASPGPPGVRLDVPFVKQEKEGCGAAAISMVMQYWNRDHDPGLAVRADPRSIQQALYSRQAHGIFASAIEHYFKQAGFRAFAFQGSWDDLKNHLLKGRPLIACLKEAGRSEPRHYVVVAGLDWERNVVFVNDPARRKLVRLERESFERSWSATGNWTLLAVPKPQE